MRMIKYLLASLLVLKARHLNYSGSVGVLEQVHTGICMVSPRVGLAVCSLLNFCVT